MGPNNGYHDHGNENGIDGKSGKIHERMQSKVNGDDGMMGKCGRDNIKMIS